MAEGGACDTHDRWGTYRRLLARGAVARLPRPSPSRCQRALARARTEPESNPCLKCRICFTLLTHSLGFCGVGKMKRHGCSRELLQCSSRSSKSNSRPSCRSGITISAQTHIAFNMDHILAGQPLVILTFLNREATVYGTILRT
eukprot:scaffold8172_cov65-Phaeocystis_antarctica.AAC.1